MTDLFLYALEISIFSSIVILLVFIFAPVINRRYEAKWRRLLWISISFRLALSVRIMLPLRQVLIEMPRWITLPIGMQYENTAPVAEQAIGQIVNENMQGIAVKASTVEQITRAFSFLDAAAALWIVGAMLFILMHLFSVLHLKRQIIKKGTDVNDIAVLNQAYDLSRELHINRVIRMKQYADVESPMVIGLIKPVMVLPCCDYSTEELYFVLKHELIHIKSGDLFVKFLFVTANAVHWFNPIIYMMRKEAAIDMELACDEKVVESAGYSTRKAYTEMLFSTLDRQRRKGNALTTQFYGGKKIMEKRFVNTLSPLPKKNGLLFSVCMICFIVASGFLVGCSVSKSEVGQRNEELYSAEEERVEPAYAEYAENDDAVEMDSDRTAENAPAESASAESTPAESTPAESTPAESTPAESASTENAPTAKHSIVVIGEDSVEYVDINIDELLAGEWAASKTDSRRVEQIKLGDVTAQYECIPEASEDKLKDNLGSAVGESEGWYRISGHEGAEYLINVSGEKYTLWKLTAFLFQG